MIAITKRGVTLLETLIAAIISMLAIAAGTSAFFSGTSAWANGEIEMASEGSGNYAIRIIANELREAMFVKVSSDGMRIDYVLPMKDVEGAFVFPLISDGVNRRFYFDGSDLILREGGDERVICENVLIIDPRIATGAIANEGVGNGKVGGTTGGTGGGTGGGGSGAQYIPFIPTAGVLTREITVKIVTKSQTRNGVIKISSKREVILARNVPRIF